MQACVVLLIVPGVRDREYHVAGKAAGAECGGEVKIALGNQAILDGLFGFRRGWLCEAYPVVCLHEYRRVGRSVRSSPERFGRGDVGLFVETPTTTDRQRRGGDAFIGRQRLHALEDAGEPIRGFLERVVGFGLDFVDMVPEFLKDLCVYHEGDCGRCPGSPTNQGMHGVDVVDAQLISDRCPNNVENGAGVHPGSCVE